MSLPLVVFKRLSSAFVGLWWLTEVLGCCVFIVLSLANEKMHISSDLPTQTGIVSIPDCVSYMRWCYCRAMTLQYCL